MNKEMTKEYPRLHSIKTVKGLLIETCEGSGTEESPNHLGFYFAQENEDGTYRICKIVEGEI